MEHRLPQESHDYQAKRCCVRRLPDIVSSFEDCGQLFNRFKRQIAGNGQAGIVGIMIEPPEVIPLDDARAIELFTRFVGRQLTARIEGGYKAQDGEFFVLLVPAGRYGEDDFKYDLDKIEAHLTAYISSPRHCERFVVGDATGRLKVDGVFLENRGGDNADNTLLLAFKELFSASSRPPAWNDEEEMLAEIISNRMLSTVWQPIVDLVDGTINGHEALSRVWHPSSVNIEKLLHIAALHGRTAELDMLCRQIALGRAAELRMEGRLFLNVYPLAIQAESYARGMTAAFLDELGIDRSRVIFELTERTLIDDYDLFKRTLAHYRDQGYSIAIDDLGTGYAGLKMLAELEPEYVKLARFLVDNVHQSSTRQALVEALVNFCSRIGATVIAEGIEQKAELSYLRSIGVRYGQGYLLARPAPTPVDGSFDFSGL